MCRRYRVWPIADATWAAIFFLPVAQPKPSVQKTSISSTKPSLGLCFFFSTSSDNTIGKLIVGPVDIRLSIPDAIDSSDAERRRSKRGTVRLVWAEPFFQVSKSGRETYYAI
jgi:hypothetical protein